MKKSCNTELVKARLYSSVREMWARETIRLVMVVPILAPITMGMAFSKLRIPEPTRPTIIEVVVEEDWIMAVARIPIIRPTRGLDVAPKMATAKSLPNNLKAEPSRVMDRIKIEQGEY